MAVKSYYDILEISKDADDASIKKAYRKLARKYHPDTTKDEDGEAKFKEIGEAYEVLKDSRKRDTYDQFGTINPRPQHGRGQGQWHTSGDIDLNELMRRFHEMNTGNPNPSYSSGGGISVQKVQIPVDAMFTGGQVSFRYTTQRGDDRFLSFSQHIATTVLKPDTKVGTKVKIPNIPNMEFILIPAGNERCAIQGIDIIVPFAVNALVAAAGNKCKVSHPNGKLYDVTIPKGTQNGTALRLPKMGLHHINGAVGNLIGVVNFVVPDLSDEEQAALKKLLKEA
jgi:curved DNA-binding protein